MQDSQPSHSQPGWLRVLLVGRRPRRTLLRLAVLIVGCVIVFKFILLPIRITGSSMLPTYRDGQINFANRLAYRWREPRRGDVVSIRLAGPHAMLLKRIVGLPGETVAFRAGRAYINGRLLDEPYLRRPCNWEHGPVVCGPNEYYVVGDNRSMPFELHEQGRAERSRILGRPLL